jgi:hypothetical protein
MGCGQMKGNGIKWRNNLNGFWVKFSNQTGNYYGV